MTPSRHTIRSPRSAVCSTGLCFRVVVGIAVLVTVGTTAGCQHFAGNLINSALGLDVRTVTEQRLNDRVLDQRTWDLEYTEDLILTADRPGVSVVVDGQPIGVCPVTLRRPATAVQIEEHGFYVGDDYWRVKYREEDDRHGNPRRELLSETYLRTERRGPTRWIGHRVVTADFPPLYVIWKDDDQVIGLTILDFPPDPFTLKSPPPDADAVLVEALNQLTWNRDIADPAVPGHAHGIRTLHWAEPADVEAIAK